MAENNALADLLSINDRYKNLWTEFEKTLAASDVSDTSGRTHLLARGTLILAQWEQMLSRHSSCALSQSLSPGLEPSP